MKNKIRVLDILLIAFMIIFPYILIHVYINKVKSEFFSTERTSIRISALPAASSFDDEDLFIVADGGTISRKLTGLQVRTDMVTKDNSVRSEMYDSLVVFRALIGAGGGGDTRWTRWLGRMYPTNDGDSLGVGLYPTRGKFEVDGHAYIDGAVTADYFFFPGGGAIWANGDDIELADNNNPTVAGHGVSLSTLIAGGSSDFSKTGVTNYTPTASDNWHFGGSAETTYKVKVTGNFNATATSYLNGIDVSTGNVNLLASGAYLSFYGNYALRAIDPNSISLYDVDAGYNNRLNFTISSEGSGGSILTVDGNGVEINSTTNKVRLIAGNNGYVSFDGTYMIPNVTDTLATMAYARANGGSGGGIVDTTGLPEANHVTYFTSATKIAGSSNFTFDGDSVRLVYLNGGASGTRFFVGTPSGAIDTGVLHPVYRGLTDPLWDIHKHLADTKNKEIRWAHIEVVNGKDSVFYTYGLPEGMDAFEALQYTAEMSLRELARQDSINTSQDIIVKNLTERIRWLENKQPPDYDYALFYLGIVLLFLGLFIIVIIKK